MHASTYLLAATGCQLTTLLSIAALQQLPNKDGIILFVDGAPLQRTGRGGYSYTAHILQSLQLIHIIIQVSFTYTEHYEG